MDQPRATFAEQKHPRAPKGSDTGGQFAPLSYDAKKNTGAGYSSKSGDSRVKKVQSALNRLGLTDGKGKELDVDGKLGPRTTEAIKAAQKKLGLPQDGKLTPGLLKALSAAKTPPKPKRRSTLVSEFCVRSFNFEARALTGDGRTLEGYAAVFNAPTRIRDRQGDFDEVILPGAFERSLEKRTPVLQFDHGKDARVGSVPIGVFEEIREDGKGLYVRARLFDNPVVEPVRQAIEGQAIRGMSFRFMVPDGGDTWTNREGGVDLREIRDTDTAECGPVVFPAYDQTSVSVRSLLAQLDPDEYGVLIRELAAELRLAADPSDLTGRPDARSAGGGDHGTTSGNDGAPAMSHRQRLDEGALLIRGIKKP